MKKILFLSMLTFFTMLCSCQKQDAAAEQRLSQRKADLDARNRALDERVNALNERMDALDQRVNMLDEKESASTNAQKISRGVQGQIPDPARLQAERDKRIEEAAAARDQVLDPSQVEFEKAEKAEKAEKERQTRERVAQRQRSPQDVERQKRRKWEISQNWRMSDSGGSSSAEAGSAPPAPVLETASPSASPRPQ